MNAAHYNKLFWDGSVTSLESQAAAAAEGGVAGNGDRSLMEMRLRFIPEYVESFQKVFGGIWPRMNDAYRAIAAYQRTVVSDATKVPFDRYARGDKKALSASQQAGMKLFNGKAACIQCHNGPLASNERYYDLGLPDFPGFKEDPLYQVTHRWQVYQKGVPEPMYRGANMDYGLYFVTKNPKNIGQFRTPSLREVKYTGPYMHNGVFQTLEEVVDFYNRGGGKGHNKTTLLKPLHLSHQEKRNLISFVEALSMTEPWTDHVPQLPGNYQALPEPTLAKEH
jgi:cytochrome c peroxidase